MGTQKVFKMKFYEINTPAENIILILFFRKNNFQSTKLTSQLSHSSKGILFI